MIGILLAALLWGTTGTAATLLPDAVSPLATGAATMTTGGLLLALTAPRGARTALRTPGALQSPGQNSPISARPAATAPLPLLFRPQYHPHPGFLLVVAATAFVWWALNPSSPGFRLRSARATPPPARVG